MKKEFEELIKKIEKIKIYYESVYFDKEYEEELKNYLDDLEGSILDLGEFVMEHTSDYSYEELEKERDYLCRSQGISR